MLREHFCDMYHSDSKSQAGGVLSYVLFFFGNLSRGVLIKCVLIKTRPIAISRVLREQRPTDRPTDGPTDRPTEWLIESRARD